jgi:hypothetical protein
MKQYIVTLQKHDRNVGSFSVWANSAAHAIERTLFHVGARTSTLGGVKVQKVTDRTPFIKLIKAEVI